MKIRSITCFINPDWPLDQVRLKRAAGFIQAARSAFLEAGYEVQTTRLASVPFFTLLNQDVSKGVEFAATLEDVAREVGFDYVSIGTVFPDQMAGYSIIPEILEKTSSVFASGVITHPEKGISLEAVWECANVIKRNAEISSDGLVNLRFAALASVRAGAPFFPAAYHHSEEEAFALALEAADLAVEAVRQGSNLKEARRSLIESIERNAAVLSIIGDELAERYHINFAGIDFSLAPFPKVDSSIGTALEDLTGTKLGSPATLAGVGFFADAINQAQFNKVGFCGVMLPVLEDLILARRVAEGRLRLSDLLLYSAVCGTGLDTIPLPGDIGTEQIHAILVDLGTLSLRLNKQLTARLMPVPGKKAGEETDFDFPYFANSRIMSIDQQPGLRLFTGDAWFPLISRMK